VTTRLSAVERRRQLIDCAVETFAVGGFHATSVSDVAASAGVTKPVLYHHFASKRELYREVLRDVGARLHAAIEKATIDAPGPRAQLERGIAAFFRFVSAEEAAFLLLFGAGTRRDEEFEQVASDIESAIGELVAARLAATGVDPAGTELTAFGVLGFAETVARRWLAAGRPVGPDTVAAMVSNVLWSGLRSFEPPGSTGPSAGA